MAGQDDNKSEGEATANIKITDPSENVDNISEEYDFLDTKLDELNSALDFLEQKNDDIHAKLKALLQSNIDIRQQLRNENMQPSDSKTNE